ncbi:MAG: DUF2849 domain-containing protein [Pseudomonadota bacterium]
MKVKSDFHIVSANLLLEGDIVYRTAGGGWSRAWRDAAVSHGREAADALLASAAAEPHLVVDAQLAPVFLDAAGQARPATLRERIRALGPTTRTDLGKQADLAPEALPGALEAA